MSDTVTFKDRHPAFQHLAWEMMVLHTQNCLVIKDGSSGHLRVFSLLALGFVTLERFLRIVLGDRAREKATLNNLLEQATGKREQVFVLHKREENIKLVNELRTGMMHGLLGADAEAEDLLNELIPFSFDLYTFVNNVVASVDHESGASRQGVPCVCFDPSRVLSGSRTAVLTPHDDLESLRQHNLRFGQGDSKDTYLLLAEGALCLVLVEAICRKATGMDAVEGGGAFRTVLTRAIIDGSEPLKIPFADKAMGVDQICDVRNALLHANYEQAARAAKCTSVPQYFKTQFAPEVEATYQIYRCLRQQLVERGLLSSEDAA